MTESYSRLRQAAEIAFGKTQSPMTSRERAFEELDAQKLAREEKTRRLREARHAKELLDKAKTPATPARKPPSGR